VIESETLTKLRLNKGGELLAERYTATELNEIADSFRDLVDRGLDIINNVFETRLWSGPVRLDEGADVTRDSRPENPTEGWAITRPGDEPELS
jgi:hypothetical protein